MFHEAAYAYFELLPSWAQAVVTGLVLGIVVFVLGALVRAAVLGPATRRLEATLRSFVENVVAAVLWILVVVAALLGFGVPASALAGLLAVFGFVIGFALQDTFGNLAAGVLLLLNKPFVVGEAVAMAGEEGTVEALGVSMTRLRTWDGRMLVIPNGAILGGAIVNFTRNPTRRVEVTVGVGYGDSIDGATKAILETLGADARIKADPKPDVLVTALADSSVNLKARGWVSTPDYHVATSELTGRIKQALDEAGISIPFPQREVAVTVVGGGSLAPSQ